MVSLPPANCLSGLITQLYDITTQCVQCAVSTSSKQHSFVSQLFTLAFVIGKRISVLYSECWHVAVRCVNLIIVWLTYISSAADTGPYKVLLLCYTSELLCLQILSPNPNNHSLPITLGIHLEGLLVSCQVWEIPTVMSFQINQGEYKTRPRCDHLHVGNFSCQTAQHQSAKVSKHLLTDERLVAGDGAECKQSTQWAWNTS